MAALAPRVYSWPQLEAHSAAVLATLWADSASIAACHTPCCSGERDGGGRRREQRRRRAGHPTAADSGASAGLCCRCDRPG